MFRMVVLLIVSAATSVASAAAAISYLPAYPVPEKPIALRVDDDTSNGGNVVGPHVVSVSGQTIRVEGCLGTRGLPIGGPYSATLTLSLPVGDYVVEYYRAVDFDQENCTISGSAALELRGSAQLKVANTGPNWPPPAGDVASVYEYIHLGFGGHFFMTADEDEKLAIESGRFTGWDRYNPRYDFVARRFTGSYGFFTSAMPDRVPICRFFSNAFAPKSSHVYTTHPPECEALKQNPTWTYEGIVAHVWPARDDGSCAQGLPLYRLYNNGRTGAPNHFYTVSESLRDSFVNSGGWTPEGVGKGVIACVPAMP